VSTCINTYKETIMDNLCDYGCQAPAKYTLKNGKQCCNKTYQQCPAIKEKNRQGTKKAYIDGVRSVAWTSEHRKKSSDTRKQQAIDNFLIDGSTLSNHAVKNRLCELGVPQCCKECGIDTWNGKTIPLELDHINGKSKDNRLDNLRLLCPNCHSLTDTWRGKNINTGKIKVSDNELLTAYDKTANIRQTLIEVGLAPKGGNYSRVKKLISGRGEIG
jgi:5-methylcytosine-specific restriction endonuclease McrA